MGQREANWNQNASRRAWLEVGFGFSECIDRRIVQNFAAGTLEHISARDRAGARIDLNKYHTLSRHNGSFAAGIVMFFSATRRLRRENVKSHQENPDEGSQQLLPHHLTKMERTGKP